jgi:hypothetical protein
MYTYNHDAFHCMMFSHTVHKFFISSESILLVEPYGILALFRYMPDAHFRRNVINANSSAVPDTLIALRTLFPNTLSLYFFHNVRDKVLHPYKTTGKIIVLYILIFALLGCRRED